MINHDDLILKILSNKCGYIDSNKLRKINIKYPLIKYYLENRFDYIENLNEAFNRIKYHIEIRPKCQAITIWTIKDPEKRDCAQRNHLNFKEVWDLYERKEFIDYIYNEFKNLNV